MENENYVLQMSVKGTDDAGREIMWNVRGATCEDFDTNLKHVVERILKLKGLPAKPFGKREAKPVTDLPDAPSCATHHVPMRPKEWKNAEGETVVFWTCPQRDNGTFCKERSKPAPTPEQIIKFKELNG